MNRLHVAVVGCGLIGRRRAEIAARHARSAVEVVCDSVAGAAGTLAGALGCSATTDWRSLLADPRIDIVCIATPNGFMAEIAIEALRAGKHVLLEKPMGRNLAEALAIADAALQTQRTLKIGFNHRYHPALSEAHRRFVAGEIGELVNIRARYGHGGRPGYEREWRGNPKLAGGGELTDQGVHITDLINWFAGMPADVFGYTQTAVWPIGPLEDNGFGLFRFSGGQVASMHTSWTQWKNLFSFEVFGALGSAAIDGLGGSYGPERLTVAKRNPAGGVPASEELLYEGPDASWSLEWDDFLGAVLAGTPYLGTPEDGIAAMGILDALYRSVRSGEPVHLD